MATCAASTRKGDRLYGRGTADNKGQHTINMAALRAVMAERGERLGFNAKFMIEIGEEAGSKGLDELVRGPTSPTTCSSPPTARA